MKLALFLFLLAVLNCEEIPIYSNSNSLKFAEIQNYSIEIEDISISELLTANSYLSVFISVIKTPECIKSKVNL